MVRRLACIFFYLALAPALHAQGWEERIADAKAREDAIVAWAAQYDWDYNMIGMDIRWADVANMRCEILAEMIGLGDISGYLTYYGPRPDADLNPPLGQIDPDTYDFYRILGYAINLGGWAHFVEGFLGDTDDQRAEYWELTCNGQHGIPEGLLGPDWAKTAMFTVDGRWLTVLGDIEPGFFSAFAETVAKHDITGVNLGSRGGSVMDAMQAGGLIRALDMDVSLHADCESACPLVYFGGHDPRVVVALPPFRLGFHQVSANGVAIPLDSPIYETIGAYVQAMGVDEDFVLSAMRSAPPDDMFFPDFQSLCDANAIAWVRYHCSQSYPEDTANR